MRAAIAAILVAAVTSTVQLLTSSSPPTSRDGTEASEGSGPQKNWAVPFNGAGVEVPSIADAQRSVDFSILPPSGFSPTHILVNSQVDAVGFSFYLPGAAGGWVQLVESKTASTPQQYQDNFLKNSSQPAGFFSATTLDNNRVLATLAAANSRGRLLWVDGGVQFDIAGEAMTPAQVKSLVSQMLYKGR